MAEAEADATEMAEAEPIRDGRYHGTTPVKKKRARTRSPPSLCSVNACTKSKISGFKFCVKHGGGHVVFCVVCGTNVGGQARKSGKGPDEDDEAAQISFSVFLALAAGQFPVSGLERTPKRLCKACSNYVPKKEYRATVVVTSHPPLQRRAIKLGLPASFYENDALRKAMADLKKEYEAQDFTKINSRIAKMPLNKDWKLFPFGESVNTGFPHSFIHSHP